MLSFEKRNQPISNVDVKLLKKWIISFVCVVVCILLSFWTMSFIFAKSYIFKLYQVFCFKTLFEIWQTICMIYIVVYHLEEADAIYFSTLFLNIAHKSQLPLHIL
jgi:hypothetical protein